MELMVQVIAFILLFNATAYAPDSMYSEIQKRNIQSRAINGKGTDAKGLNISEFTLACGEKYIGYIFIFVTEVPESQVRYCTDIVEHGKQNKRIDIAITEGSNDKRNQSAFQFGRRNVLAKVISSKDFLKCRGISTELTKSEIYKAVLSQLYIKTGDCL
jgi:hypothetical protein